MTESMYFYRTLIMHYVVVYCHLAEPATPSPYSLHLIGNHRAGTLIVHLPAAAAPREGIKRLPITSYSAYYCAEDRSRKRCSKSQPEVWIHGKDLVANSTEIPSDGVKFTIGKVPLGHHYRVLIKIHTLYGLDFSIRTRQSVLFVDPTASYSPPSKLMMYCGFVYLGNTVGCTFLHVLNFD